MELIKDGEILPIRDITKEDVRQIGLRFGMQGIAIYAIDQKGQVHLKAWAQDPPKMRALGSWFAQLGPTILTKIPFQTMFGNNKGGVPTPLTQEEYDKLTPNYKKTADKFNGKPV